jgi:FKBP-type peptidyl-prolyl cis-trans isomerase (trigger factor)
MVTVKELKERVLPPLDDDLAKAASEFDTLAELRGDIEGRLRAQIDDEIEGLFRAAAIDELVRASNFTAAGPLVEARTRELLSGLARSLQARGIDANTYLELIGQSPEVLEQRLRAEASMSVSRELVLEAVADQLGIQVGDDEIREELRAAGESDEDIEAFVAEGGADRVRDDIRLKKALDRIAAEVQPIAPDLHEARESIWTPEKDEPAEPAKLWTPGSKE